jgi:hypothetical protein
LFRAYIVAFGILAHPSGILHDHFVSGSAGRHRRFAVDANGGRLPGAAAHLQSGWVDTIWTFSLGLTSAGSALWPVAGASGGRFSEKIVLKMKGVVT